MNLEELDQIIDRSTRAPLSEAEGQKLKTALHAMAERLLPKREHGEDQRRSAAGCGAARTSRMPANLLRLDTGATVPRRLPAQTGLPSRTPRSTGDRCPECRQGKVYRQKEPKALVRIVGHAPLAATVFELERLRCSACGQVFTADEPEDGGPEKYDETAAAMIAQLKYGSGVPFNRLERLEEQLGIPLPAATQWEIDGSRRGADQAGAGRADPAGGARQVMHNDDTGMRVLRLAREPGDKRTGVFTSGIVSTGGAGRSRCSSPDGSMRARTSPRC